LLVAIGGGLLLSGILFLLPWAEKALMPLIVGFKAVPLVALAPLFLLWFGSGTLSKALMAATICFFPLVVGLMRGFRSCSDEEILFLRDVKLSRWQELTRFRLWKATPFFLAGLRVGSVLAVVGAIVGEFTGARAGLGYVVMVAAVRIDTPLLFVGILLSATCGLALYGLALGLERLALRRLQLEPIDE
jgi:NitT/TauT family transport system permease protein